MHTFMFRRKPLLLLAAALSFLGFIVFSQQVMADMFSWFKKYDVHLSPAVQGKISFNGNPVANIKVFRELTYDKEYLDHALTDSQGNFSFDEKNIRSSRPGSLLETFTRQVLFLDHNGKRHILWRFTNRTTEPAKTINSLLNGLRCDLSNPDMIYDLENQEHPAHPHVVSGICTFETETHIIGQERK
ncbi:DUF6795 domain-containing protein [Rheinheimera sp.]|uniref:DUF6795 domain-containing protein n=1 Tax=Rheinheimera sp. TaxID=1869214 RepID=UPI002732D3D8|nr:DUF6795 domain-containing protein [Rheinheimera sp.]MDP2716619.1 hypothetical protein [Rheinheimera sp.]